MPNPTTINFELLDAGINDAATQAGGYQHRQDNYATPIRNGAEVCGTGLCLAGFIGVRLGAQLPPLLHEWDGTPYYDEWTVNPHTGEYDQNGVHIADFAANNLGVNHEQAEALFFGENSLDGLRRMRSILALSPTADFDDLVDGAADGDDDDD